MVGDDRSALQAVVAADVELMELREEEEELNKQLQDSTLEDKPKGFDADEASERLNEVSADEHCCCASLLHAFEVNVSLVCHLFQCKCQIGSIPQF